MRLSEQTKLPETDTKRPEVDTLTKRLEIMMPPEGRGFESHRLRQNCGFDRTKSRRGNSAAQFLIQGG